MRAYEIKAIDPTVEYIITVDDDRPLVNSDGQPVCFKRRIDAERWIEEGTRPRRTMTAHVFSAIDDFIRRSLTDKMTAVIADLAEQLNDGWSVGASPAEDEDGGQLVLVMMTTPRSDAGKRYGLRQYWTVGMVEDLTHASLVRLGKDLAARAIEVRDRA